MSAVSSVFKREYHIDLRDVDFKRRLKFSTLFSYFQDIGSLASEDLGFGIETLGEKFDVSWILTRMRVNIIQHPVWNEDITIETWPLEPGKVDFDRDYLVKDARGNIIIRAVSKWIIMDNYTRKIKRTETIGIQYPENITERAIEGKLPKLKRSGELETVYNKVIGYSDIDFNGHLNNTKYVDYITDCFSMDDHKNNSIYIIDLNFNSETLPGDTITLYKDTSKTDEDSIYIEGINQTYNSVAFKSFIKFRPKKV